MKHGKNCVVASKFLFGFLFIYLIILFIYIYGCLRSGVIVPGGFGTRGVEGKIEACKWCRENNKPFLGICLGLQVAVIEFARYFFFFLTDYIIINNYIHIGRNVLNLENANTTEINPDTKEPLIIEMPEHCPENKGGTMRLGKRTTIFKKECSSVTCK